MEHQPKVEFEVTAFVPDRGTKMAFHTQFRSICRLWKCASSPGQICVFHYCFCSMSLGVPAFYANLRTTPANLVCGE